MLYPSRTARLALRAWREKDRPAFAAMNADERVKDTKADGQLAFFVTSDIYYAFEKYLDGKSACSTASATSFRPRGSVRMPSNVFRTESCWDSPDCTA